MKKFDLETHFINIPPEPNLSETGILKTFFKERRIVLNRIIEVLKCPRPSFYKWFTKGVPITAIWKPEFEALRDRFIEWEKLHGFMFNSEEHIAAYKLDPETPRLEPFKLEPSTSKHSPISKRLSDSRTLIKNAPYHDCPYIEDGLNFGSDYNEYDVCDDCFLSVACYKYKMKFVYSEKSE